MPVSNQTNCPSHEELAAFGAGNITNHALGTISKHLAVCETCISVLLTIPESDDSLLNGLRRLCSDEQFLDEREYQRAVEGIAAIGCGPLDLDRLDGRSLRPLPSEFGRYELLEELGQGGMGVVYLARDTQLGREVALKIPHFRRSQDPHLLERFYREARAAATIDDPNLCPVYDVGEIDGIPYLTMARIRGMSLSKALKAGKQFSDRETAQIVQRVALAVEKAHACGIVHRDIKPSNIMLTEEGEPILTDFGLAQRLELEDPRLTRSGVIVGTPSYMAPEQVDGDPETLGPACDIYSLGVVLYELLTGRAPFEGPLLSVLSRLGRDQPDPPSSHCPDVDRRLEAICLNAIAKAPADRYQSAGALAEALDESMASSSQPPRPPLWRRRLVRLSAAAFLLVAGVIIYINTGDGTFLLKMTGRGTKVVIDDAEHGRSTGRTVFLSFDSPISGTILDKNGSGTGFTHRLPGTGRSLPTKDPNLELLHAGSLLITSSHVDINEGSHLDRADTPGLFLRNVARHDLRVAALFRDVQLDHGSDSIVLYAGTSRSQVVKGGLHRSFPEGVCQWLFECLSNKGPMSWSKPSFGDPNPENWAKWSNGDDVRLTLSRTGAQWRLSWENLSRGENGGSPTFSFPWLDNEDELYVGVHYANARAPPTKKSRLDYFSVTTKPRPGLPVTNDKP